jgi:malonyl CoA-acyl carrier protein transacylase
MTAHGLALVVECGPGKVLAPLVKRIVDGADGVALFNRDAIMQAIASVRGA